MGNSHLGLRDVEGVGLGFRAVPQSLCGNTVFIFMALWAIVAQVQLGDKVLGPNMKALVFALQA